MRTGAIICISGQAPKNWTKEDEADFREKLDTYEVVRIMPALIDTFQLHCAWIELMSKGMTDIIIAKAEFMKTGKLEFTGFSCALPVVSMN